MHKDTRIVREFKPRRHVSIALRDEAIATGSFEADHEVAFLVGFYKLATGKRFHFDVFQSLTRSSLLNNTLNPKFHNITSLADRHLQTKDDSYRNNHNALQSYLPPLSPLALSVLDAAVPHARILDRYDTCITGTPHL